MKNKINKFKDWYNQSENTELQVVERYFKNRKLLCEIIQVIMVVVLIFIVLFFMAYIEPQSVPPMVMGMAIFYIVFMLSSLLFLSSIKHTIISESNTDMETEK